MARVAIVVAPGMAEDGPALGPHLLQAALRARGHACDVLYLNLVFAAKLGLSRYRSLDRLSTLLPLEWAFAPLVHPTGLPAPEAYAEEVWRRPDLPSAALVNVRQLAEEFAAEMLAAHAWSRYDLVGFSSSFQQTNASIALARRLKVLHPRLVIALGGANAEGPMGEALSESFAVLDAVFSGEADRTFPRWVDEIAAGRAGPVPPPEPVIEMDDLPIPDFGDYFDALAKSGLDLEPGSTSLRLEIGRGCWWGARAHCTFCGLNGEAMSWRRKSTPRFLEELRAMTRWPTRSVLLTDNILPADAGEDLLPRLAEAKTGFRFFAEIKIPIPAETVRRMRAAGIRRVQPGLESLSTPSLGRMRKGTRAVENVAFLSAAAAAGVSATWNLLVGFPRETASDIDRMSGLLPWLHHLQPPVGLFPVEIHRFSPLHDDRERLGVGAIRPAAAYRHVHALPPEVLARLAYVFERVADDWPDDYVAAVARLADAVDDWRLKARSGQAVLVFVDDGRALHGIDTRDVARERRWRADGAQREMLLACTEPRSTSDLDPHALAALTARRLVLELDARALALPLASDVALEGRDEASIDRALAIALPIASGLQRMHAAEAGG